jgi:hypothetical protein
MQIICRRPREYTNGSAQVVADEVPQGPNGEEQMSFTANGRVQTGGENQNDSQLEEATPTPLIV